MMPTFREASRDACNNICVLVSRHDADGPGVRSILMESSFTVARIRGIPIGVHYTWSIAMVMMTWSLAVGYFPTSYPGWDRIAYWGVGASAALLLFVSVVLHELCHSFVAQ